MNPSDEASVCFRRYQATNDIDALSRVFDLVAPQLLLIATHMSRGQGQPEDLLQATFLDAIQHVDSYDPERPLKPWLIGILTNQLRNARRRDQRQLDRRRLPESRSLDPSLSAEAKEFAEALARAIESLPSTYRHVLNLYLVHGLTQAEIAHSMGRSSGTVKSWVHRGLSLLRSGLPVGFGAALTLLVTPSRGLAAVKASLPGLQPTSIAAATGSALMGAGWIVAAALVVLLLAGWLAWFGIGGAEVTSIVSLGDTQALGESEVPSRLGTGTGTGSARVQTLDLASGIRLRVTAGAGRVPLPFARAQIVPNHGANPHLYAMWHQADANGVAEIPAPVGAVVIRLAGGGSCEVIVRGQGLTDAHIHQADGIQVKGQVVDSAGKGIEAARIWLSTADYEQQGAVVTHTDVAGNFEIPLVAPGHVLFAFTTKHCASPIQTISAGPKSTQSVRIVLDLLGASVDGVVADQRGQPVPFAVLMIGELRRARPRYHEAPWRNPRRLVADAKGHFHCDGLQAGTRYKFWVRAKGFRLLVEQLLTPAAGQTKTLVPRLDPGIHIHGRLRDALGRPVDAADVFVRPHALSPVGGEARDSLGPLWHRGLSVTASDGQFSLEDAPAGHVTLYATHGDSWASTTLMLEPGQTYRWDPVLGRGGTIDGTLIDSAGAPLAGYWVIPLYLLGMREIEPARSDAQGRFRLRQCELRPHSLLISRHRQGGQGWPLMPKPVWRQHGVRPGPANQQITIPSAALPNSYLSGRLVDQKGDPIVREFEVCYPSGASLTHRPDADGRFRVGPLRPGRYRVTGYQGVQLKLYSDAVQLKRGRTHDFGILRQYALGTIRVHCATLSGESAADSVTRSRVSLSCQGTLHMLNIAPVGSNQQALLRAPPGVYRLTWAATGAVAVTRTVEVFAGKQLDLYLKPEPGYPVHLTLTHPPIQGSTVVIITRRDVKGAVLGVMTVKLGADRDCDARGLLSPGRHLFEFESMAGAVGSLDLLVGNDGGQQAPIRARVALR